MARPLEEISSASSQKSSPLCVGEYYLHRSWGFGLIREISLDAGSVIIDFQEKPRHRMQWEYAVQSLQLVSRDHLFVLKAERLAMLREQAASDPLALVELCVRSLGEAATVEALQEALSPSVIAPEAWKKWWDGVRRVMRQEGRFEIPTKKNQPIRIASSVVPAWQKLLQELEKPASSKSAVETARALAKAEGELSPSGREQAVSAIRAILSSPHGALPEEKLELAVLRDQFLAALAKEPEQGALAVSQWLPEDNHSLRKALSAMAASSQKEVLRRLVLERGGTVSLLLELLPNAPARTADAIVTVLADAGQANELLERLGRAIRERTIGTETLAWICRTRDELFRPLFRPDLFFCILYLLERESSGAAKKGSKLYELLTGKLAILHAILSDAHLTDARDVARAALASPVLRELDKRSLLGAILKKFPGVQDLVAGGQQQKSEEVLIVSWTSLAQKKKELEELVTKQIPENTREIAIARSYGDLRENHEYKAAKEMQGVLHRRKTECEVAIARARGTDFSDVATDSVNIGTRVVLKDLATGKERQLTILGAWDSDPAAGVVSYLAGLGQVLLGHKSGDEVTLPAEGKEEGAKVRVERIEAAGPIPA